MTFDPMVLKKSHIHARFQVIHGVTGI